MGSGGSDKYAEQAQREEARRKAEIERGTAQVRQLFSTQFTPDFYNTIRGNYLDYYRPQFEEQYGDAQNGLAYQLARSGHLDSSVRIDKEADLQQQADIQRQGLVDRALASANERRRQVQAAQEGVIAQLQSTADASGAAADAAARANYLTQPEPYEPLGQLFTDATFGLATQADLERRNASRYNTGLFNSPTSSSNSAAVVGG